MKINEIKKIAVIFLACTAGSVLIQLAAPMILAALVSAASFAIPFLIYHMVVEKGWRIRLETVNGKVGREESDAEAVEQEAEGEEEPELVFLKTEEMDSRVSSSQEEAAAFWYTSKGKMQLDRMIASLHSRGIYECWIRKDGICNFRSERGYRRAGIFQDYPGASSGTIAKLMRSEGLNAVDKGKYLYVAWAEE